MASRRSHLSRISRKAKHSAASSHHRRNRKSVYSFREKRRSRATSSSVHSPSNTSITSRELLGIEIFDQSKHLWIERSKANIGVFKVVPFEYNLFDDTGHRILFVLPTIGTETLGGGEKPNVFSVLTCMGRDICDIKYSEVRCCRKAMTLEVRVDDELFGVIQQVKQDFLIMDAETTLLMKIRTSSCSFASMQIHRLFSLFTIHFGLENIWIGMREVMDVIKTNENNSDFTEEVKKEYVNLLKIPKDIIFPLELSIHLKERLQAALEEIFKLKKQLFNQDYEVNSLHLQAEKSKCEKYFLTKENKTEMASSTQMATKLVELSKRIRDMTAEQESMKTRMKQIMAENEQLKERMLSPKSEPNLDPQEEATKKAKSEQEMISTAQQLANTTQKMMDYRRQTQQLRMELRSALKALCQEVGDGTTPQTVLSVVNGNSWRGRQQQILTLQQRNAELQARLSQAIPSLASHNGGGEPFPENQSIHDDSCSEAPSCSDVHDDKSVKSVTSSMSSMMQPAQRKLLAQQEKNKHELLEKTSRELECTKKELKASLLSMKAHKARVQTLEDQVRSYRSQIEGLEGKLGGKQMELQEATNEINRLSHELTIMKDRMKTIRDTAATEVKETHQALLMEKSNSSKLQKMLESYEAKFAQMNAEIEELQLSLSAFKNVPADDAEARKRLQFLELQFEEMKDGMTASENECRRLLSLVQESIERVEEERRCHSSTERHLIKAFAVIEHAEHCIALCLDAGNISDKKILETIEDLRSMRRELKTGDLFHLEINNTVDVRKLKSRITILNKEVAVLQKSLKQSASDRKKDLQNFASMVERSRHEFLTALSNSVKAKQLALKTFSPVTLPCEATS